MSSGQQPMNGEFDSQCAVKWLFLKDKNKLSYIFSMSEGKRALNKILVYCIFTIRLPLTEASVGSPGAMNSTILRIVFKLFIIVDVLFCHSSL